MEDKIKIKRAITADAKLISNLSAVTFSETFTGTCSDEDLLGFIEKYFSETEVYNELQDKNDFYFIGFINDKPIGYLRIKKDVSSVEIIDKHRSIELKRIYVLKEYHAQKAGAALMNFTLKFAAENNYEIVWLGVWEHNEKAKAFYKKYGFIDSGVMHDFPIGSTPQTDRWLYKFIEKQ